MKLLSFAIPCYNSEAYMEKCINSLLPGGDEVEILIINDGSTDRTGEIAEYYAARYPSIVRAIHQENGGHGEAVNTGIRCASGMYFKVVDSDDWVNLVAYEKILHDLEDLVRGPDTVDLIISNFIYDKQGQKHKKVMQYRICCPVEKVFTWNEMLHMPKGKYLLMHSLIYRTGLLRECGLKLPAHTYYVDNLFAFEPLPYVRKLYYVDVNFYRYFIGREDQSVNESVMIKRIDQQIRVNKLMVDAYERCKFPNKKVKNYMLSYLDIITTISSVMLIRAGTEEGLQKKKELLEYIKAQDRILYHKLRYSILGQAANLPGKTGRKMFVAAYKITQKFYGFN